MKRSLKDAAKKGEKESCKILAKEIVRARKAVNRLYASKAHMNSVQMQMKNQLGRLKIEMSMSIKVSLCPKKEYDTMVLSTVIFVFCHFDIQLL